MIETALHGVALGSLLSTFAATLRSRGPTAALWSFRLFCLAAGGFVIFTSPLIDRLSGAPFLLVRCLSAMGVSAFWLFATSLFSQRKLGFDLLAPFAALLSLALPAPLLSPAALLVSKIAFDLIEIILIGDVVLFVWRDAHDDLVNARYVLRTPLIAAIALACLVMTGLKLATLLGFPHGLLRMAQAWISTVLALAGAAAFTQERARLFESSRRALGAKPVGQTPDDAALEKLKSLADTSDLWRRSNLTIGVAADHFKIPEYRLRRIINRRLDYRNFSEFLNERRIELAKQDLRNPAKADLQIAAIAFDLGYASLGPFNRAFREIAKMSPREWRNSSKV